ncbi:MAG: response regulator [Chitinispirillaceae bacterium]
MEQNRYSILLVDDEPEVRELISDYLTEDEGYRIQCACCGQEALEILEKNSFDLVLSDINMPGMKGFDLLREVKERYPDIKRVLITAYNVEDYLDLAQHHDIGNIFVKTTPFNFSELSTVLHNLLGGTIFGLERHFTRNTPVHRMNIFRSNHLEQDAQKIVSFLNDSQRVKRLELVIVELLTNAIFYGVMNESAENKEEWDHNFELSDETAVEVSVAADTEKYAVSVVDRGGRLKKQDVLYWLHRQIAQDERGYPLGLFDSHGRGLFIARRYIDRLIINIDPNKLTEVIIINYLNHTCTGSKPLYINEL